MFLDVPNFYKALRGLRDLNGLGDFLLRFSLRHGDGQDAVLNLGRDLIFHHIIRQRVALLVVRVAELAAQIVMVLVLLLVLLFVFNGDGEVALVVDGYAAIFFLDAWSCKRTSTITICAVSSAILTTSRTTYCQTMW